MPDSGTTDNTNFISGRRTAARSRVEDAIRDGLVRRVRSGDREAFDELYGIFSPMVHGIVLAAVPQDDVDDIVQEVFLAAFRGLESLRDENYIGGWLASIARNHAREFHRGPRRSEELTDEMSESMTDGRVCISTAHEIADAIRALPETYRETLMMRLVGGLTGPEIASLTGHTQDSVRVHLHRGMKMLRDRLGVAGTKK